MFGAVHTVAVSPWSRFLLGFGYPITWREQRKENVKTFLNLISAHPSIQPLFTEWPDSNCPFNAILLFSCKEDRDKYRSRLIGAGVYPSVHWELNSYAPSDFLDLSHRIMTIPVDQRYCQEDMKCIASIFFNE
jgi:hypothetical protein